MTQLSLSDALLSYAQGARRHADGQDIQAVTKEALAIAHDAFTDLIKQPHSACSSHVCQWLACVEKLAKIQSRSS